MRGGNYAAPYIFRSVPKTPPEYATYPKAFSYGTARIPFPSGAPCPLESAAEASAGPSRGQRLPGGAGLRRPGSPVM